MIIYSLQNTVTNLTKCAVLLARFTIGWSVCISIALFAFRNAWTGDILKRLNADDAAGSVRLKPWYIDIEEGRQVARATGKPLMIVFR